MVVRVGLSSVALLLLADPGEGGSDLLLEAGDWFSIGGGEGLLGFDLRTMCFWVARGGVPPMASPYDQG
jgi:hypothetical protein